MAKKIVDFDPDWAFPDYRPVAAFKSLRFALFIVELASLLMSDGELKIAWNRKEKKNIPNKITNKICQKNLQWNTCFTLYLLQQI